MDFDFYGNEFSAQKKVKADKDGKETLSWKSAEKLETLRRNFISDMEKNLVDRKCYVISFSTGIETLDMSDFASGDALAKLVQFLRMSFNGGTDASPALHHTVQMLQKDGYRNADVLMISDFVMGTLPDDLVEAITAEKENDTDFYSLVIGTSGNKGTIERFNHNWVYDTTDAHAARRLVEQLYTLRTSR